MADKLYLKDLPAHERARLEKKRASWFARKQRPNRQGMESIDYGEWCWLMRFRAHMTLEEVASYLDVSDVCIIEWERQLGRYSRLITFWERYYKYGSP